MIINSSSLIIYVKSFLLHNFPNFPDCLIVTLFDGSMAILNKISRKITRLILSNILVQDSRAIAEINNAIFSNSNNTVFSNGNNKVFNSKI